MPVIVSGLVGPAVLQDGAPSAPIRQGKTGEVVVTELHGKYFEQAYRGNVFTVAQAAAGVVMTTVGATAAFALANPFGSGKNLSLIRIEAVIKVLPGTPVIGYYGIYVNTAPQAAAVNGTALAAINALVGSGFQSVAKPFTTATLPATPTLFRPFEQKTTTAEAPLSPPPVFAIDFDGTLLVAPGCTVSVNQDAADTSNATMVVFATWEENPV